MRAMSCRPCALRRKGTSLTLISNFAFGSYRDFDSFAAAMPGTLMAANAVISFRNVRRASRCGFMSASSRSILGSSGSFDHPVGAQENRSRNRKAERFGGPGVDDQVEL